MQTKVGCENHTVSVSWTPSVGALMYTVTLERTDGEITFCTTDGTGCDITQLPCGEMYVLAVTAEGRTCNTSESMRTIVRTGTRAHSHTRFYPCEDLDKTPTN